MIEIYAQITNFCPACRTRLPEYLLPFSEPDKDSIKDFKVNQVVRCQVYDGIKKERVLKQLRLYWATCDFIAHNTESLVWNTKEKVDFHNRVDTHFVDPDLIVVRPDGSVQFSYRSIAMKNLKHFEACRFFDRAFDLMTDFYNAEHEEKITKNDLIRMVKETMKGVG